MADQLFSFYDVEGLLGADLRALIQYDYSNDFLFYYIFKNMINRFGEKKLSFVNEKEEFFTFIKIF